MDIEYRSKLHQRLASFEKHHKQWEWSDLIKWIAGLKSVCEKYNSKISDDVLLPTSKRLSQCLNPSLPHGIHLETLGLYNVILKQSTTEDIYLLSSGLFPHFQYCSSENKPLYLSIIDEHYIKNASLKLMTCGIVSCLLTGAGDKQETMLKVMDLLDSMAHKPELHRSVWRFILKSTEFRNIGLTYMQKRTCREYCEELIVSTLLESIDDPKIINKRLALDIIKSHFPVRAKDQVTVTLMHGVFKLYKGKDYSVIRRLWEWAYPEEVSQGQKDLVRSIAQDAIFMIFAENHCEISENKGRLEVIGRDCLKIVDEICESEDIGDDFFREICLEFVRHAAVDEIFLADQERFLRIIEKYKAIVWEEIITYFKENLLKDEEFCLNLTKFITQFLDLNDPQCVDIVIIISESLHKIQNFSSFLDFLHHFIQSSQNSSKVSVKLKKSRKRMSKLLNANQETLLLKYVFILSHFMKDHPEILEIMSYLKVLSSSNLVLTLKTLDLFSEKSLSEEDFHLFWGSLTAENDELKKILLDLFNFFPDHWWAGLLGQLVSKDREKFIKVFISFYQFASADHPEQLYKINASTRLVVKMIESLSDENPTVRHAGREWLNMSTKTSCSLVDPLLKTLLHSSTVRAQGAVLAYKKNFDCSPMLHAFTHLNSLLLHSQVLIQNMISSGVSPLCQEMCWEHKISTENYYWVLVQTCFLYINTTTEFFFNEYSKVQASACEVLRILVSRLPASFYEEILDKLGESLHKFLGKSLEYSLIPVVYTLVKLALPFFHPSKLADSAALGVLAEDSTIRQHWGRIFILAFGALDPVNVKPSCISYLSFLFISFCNLVKDYEDPVVTEALHTLIRVALFANSNGKLKTVIFSHIENLIVILVGMRKNEEVSKIFNEINEKFSLELVSILMEFWRKRYEEVDAGWEKVIQKLRLDASTLVKHVLYLQGQKKMNEIVIGNLVYNCIEQMASSVKSQDIWKGTLKIMKLLNESKWDESVVWNLKIIQLLLSITFPVGSNLKMLQKILKSILEKSRVNLVKWEKQKASPLAKVEGCTILEIVVNELIFSLNIFKIIWKDKPRSLNRTIQILSKSLLDDLNKIEKYGELILKLLSSLLFSYPSLNDNLKHGLSETIKSSLLSHTSKFPKGLDYWFDILTCFPKSQVLKLLNTYDKLFLKSSELKRKSLEKTLTIICFILMSCAKDTFIESSKFLEKRLMSILESIENNEVVFKIACLSIRIFSLKLSGFASIWGRIRGQFIPIMLRSLDAGTGEVKYEVLKVIDCFLVSFQDFQLELWMFLYDCPDIWADPEAQKSDFKPAVGKILENFCVRPRHSQVHEELQGFNQRRVVMTESRLESNEELDQYCKSLINYSMLYTAVPLDPDLKSLEGVLKSELLEVGKLIN